MKKTYFLKTLFVAACLLVGVSAWAAETVYSYDFETWGRSHMNSNTYATMGTTSAGFQVNSVDMNKLEITGSKDSEYWDLSSRFAVSANVTFRWGRGGSDVPRLGNENQSGARYISIIDLKAGDQVVITCSNVLFYSTNATYLVEETPTVVTQGSSVSSGTTYTITGEGTQRLDFSINSSTWGSITKVVITREIPEGTVEVPVNEITGANNNARTFELTCPTEGATIYYSTSEKAAGADGWTEYTTPVETEETYIWTYADKDGMTASDVVRFATGAGSTISLKGATFFKPYYDSKDKSYFVKVSDDQTNLTGHPSASLAYYTNDPESTTPFTSGETLSGFAPGTTLYVKATASGYATTTTSYYFPALTTYSVVWSDDFTSGEELTVTEAIKMGNQNCQPITKIGDTDLTGNVGVDNFNTTRFNSTTDGLWVKSSRYMGAINVFSAGLIKVAMNKNGYDNSLITCRKDISEYYAVKSADGETYDVYYTPGASSVTWNIFNGLYIKSVSFLMNPVSVTVSDAGFATYVPSYDLDFTEKEIKAYKVKVSSKGVATLTKVDNVPANTPVLLYKKDGATEDIPVMTGAAAVTGNDLVAGTGAAVATIDGDYTNMILNKVDGKIGFYFANDQTVASNRAYLHIADDMAPDAVGESRMVMVFADETTAISEELKVKSEEFATAPVYNLNGQRVEKPAKGLYIVNGKKVVMK